MSDEHGIPEPDETVHSHLGGGPIPTVPVYLTGVEAGADGDDEIPLYSHVGVEAEEEHPLHSSLGAATETTVPVYSPIGQGPRGFQGDPGLDGLNGADGRDGVDGGTPVVLVPNAQWPPQDAVIGTLYLRAAQ